MTALTVRGGGRVLVVLLVVVTLVVTVLELLVVTVLELLVVTVLELVLVVTVLELVLVVTVLELVLVVVVTVELLVLLLVVTVTTVELVVVGGSTVDVVVLVVGTTRNVVLVVGVMIGGSVVVVGVGGVQNSRPNRLQSRTICRRQRSFRPPSATHWSIFQPHARRHAFRLVIGTASVASKSASKGSSSRAVFMDGPPGREHYASPLDEVKEIRMAADISIHDVIGIQWKAPRPLPGGGYVADLVIYTLDDTRPHEVTLFAASARALVPMPAGDEVDHVG